jgi:predicted dehydrogenase
VVFNPWNLDALIEVEKETGRKVFVVHQLRYHPEIIKLREKVLNGPQDKVYNVELTYIPPGVNGINIVGREISKKAVTSPLISEYIFLIHYSGYSVM